MSHEIHYGWASCAITQNGFVTIISQPHYPSPVHPAQAIKRLAHAASTEHHEFWPCSVSLLNDNVVRPDRLHGPKRSAMPAFSRLPYPMTVGS
jgi:predicted nucleic acid-binding protein